MFMGIMGALPFILLAIGVLAWRSRQDRFDISPLFWMVTVGAAGIAILRGALSEMAALFDNGQWVVTLACLMLATALFVHHLKS